LSAISSTESAFQAHETRFYLVLFLSQKHFPITCSLANLSPVFVINALLQTSWVPSDSKLALLALLVCKIVFAACDDVDLSSNTNFNLLLEFGQSILNIHCIPAMGRFNKVDSLRALIPFLLRIETLASVFCAAASLVAFPDPIALSFLSDLESAALEILHSCSFFPPQIMYQNTKAVLALSLRLWASCGQRLLAATFQQLLLLKSRALPKNLFGVFAALNQMISDRRISQLLRDRAVEVDVCIEWLLATIHLQDPEESSDLFSISPFTSVTPNVILSQGRVCCHEACSFGACQFNLQHR
jgi:hypothetical protein